MNEIIIFFLFILIFNEKVFGSSFKMNNINNKEVRKIQGIFVITSILNNLHFMIKKDYLSLSKEYSLFNIIPLEENSYYITNRKLKKYLGYYENKIQLFHEKENIDIKRKIWNIFNVKKNKFIIQNDFNKKFIEANDSLVLFSNNFSYDLKSIKKNYIFSFLKMFEEGENQKIYLNKINKESIDIVIKYIDLTDRNLNRSNITQIYKDNDNEELRYSIRSILLNIPWIRKIFILMPNDKVRFLKSKDEIKEKIIYVKDKDFLGYDTANNAAFTLNLHKMEKFGISNNFIYIDDDYFFGKPLLKREFFYYDENQKHIYPFILTTKFKILNKTYLFNNYYMYFKKKEMIHPHSGKGFAITLLCTQKHFIENYSKELIKIEYTHNAIALNLCDLKEIYKLILKYEYINETFFSKERYILRLNQQFIVNLFQLNIKRKKVNSIQHKYFKMELLNKDNLDSPLFVINTGGNHIPLQRQYKIQKKKMENKFPYKNIFEIKNNPKKANLNNINKFIIKTIHIFIIFTLIKIQFNFID